MTHTVKEPQTYAQKKEKGKKSGQKIIKEELAVLVGFKITLKRNNAENRQSRPLMIG